jgi:hypothetical protein
MNARELASEFFQRLGARDVTGAVDLVTPQAQVHIVPAALKGSMADEGQAFFSSLADAFPDLRMRIRRTMGTDTLAIVELTMDGTQGADFLGAVNQEKYIDLDQGWMVWAEKGRITGLRAYWCQNQLLRRMAVKRLDQISITG